jgi:hypothetical protein
MPVPISPGRIAHATCGLSRTPPNTSIAVRNSRHRPAKFRKWARPAASNPRKREDFVPSRLLQAGATLAPGGREHQRVSRSSILGRTGVGDWAERRPAVQGLVSRRHFEVVPASGVNDVPEHARRRQLHQRRGRGRRVCSRGRSAHRSRLGRPARSRCSSVAIRRPTNSPTPRL